MIKSNIIQSAKELFMKYGVKSVSMDDIARHLGISKKTLYAELSNKSELVVEAIKLFIKEEKKAIGEITGKAENALQEITGIAAFVLQALRKMKPTLSYDLKKYHPRAWAIIQNDHLQQIEKTIANNLKRGIEEGYYRDDIDVILQARIYVGLAKLLAEEEIIAYGKYDKAYLYKHMMTYHLNGIMNNEGRKAINNYLNKENLA
jgi:AcrR family transcriptional regulator